MLSTGISGGTISQRILNDIQARDQWLEIFKETTRFYNDHPPFEIVFDPSLIQIGETNYTNRTANLGMRIVLDPSKAGFNALNTLLEGLEKTGRRGVWGFSGWPLSDITPKTAGTVLFNGRQTFSCKVDVSLLNENNKTIGKNSVTLNTQTINISGNTLVNPASVAGTVNFNNIRADDLTPALTIVIDAVNGIQARNLNASGYMKIETGDLEKRIAELERAKENADWEAAVAAVRAERDRQEAAAKVHYDQGVRNYNAHNYNQAIVNFRQAIQINPNYADAYNYRGNAYFYTKDYNRAIADYTQEIRLNPNYGAAYFNRGNAYLYTKDYNRAIADYTQAIRLNPNYGAAYNNRGNAYYDTKDYNRAIADYEAALRIDPNDTTYKQNLEKARRARGR
jgi:tetratricopeptide (TPR) repeat protein